MADLTDIQAAESVKIVGASSTGVESNPVNADSLGNLFVQSPSVISTANSSTAVLGANAAFTGTSEDVSNFAMITVQLFTDQISATLGFKPQYSIDGTNWDDGDAYTIVANDGKFYTFPTQAKFFRISYTNGAVAQTVFRMQCIFHRNIVKSSSHRIGDTLSDENDAELVKSINTAKRLDGVYDTLASTNNNELRTADLVSASGAEAALTVGTSAVEVKVGGSAISNRKIVTVYNNSVSIIYWGRTSGVTTSSGTPIIPGRLMVFEGFSASQPIYIIGSAASLNVRITES